MADRFRSTCIEAAGATDAPVTIEIFPTTNIRDLETAAAVLEGAGEPNGGLLLDIWHITRGGIAYEEFETIPTRWIKAIELNDAATELTGSVFEDTSNCRRFPGECDFDIPDFLEHVKATAYLGPYGVEIASRELRAMSLEDAATRSYNAAIAQFA